MQTRCGTGTNDLTKREKSSLYYEIELSKPWRSFCDRCVEVELENILKETFGGKLGYGLNHLKHLKKSSASSTTLTETDAPPLPSTMKKLAISPSSLQVVCLKEKTSSLYGKQKKKEKPSLWTVFPRMR